MYKYLVLKTDCGCYVNMQLLKFYRKAHMESRKHDVEGILVYQLLI